ncbi:N(4)-(beta-N-acetylglucosaminyl)-L-asparaginase [Bacteroidota bacterium]
MRSLFTRRNFFSRSIKIGFSLPFIPAFRQLLASDKNHKPDIPIIICCRGREAGKKVLIPAWDKLMVSGNILDAVERGANIVELDPNDTSVGFGGLPNEEGVVQLDASIMYGPTHACGSVAAIENISTPCSVARLVMERTKHIHLVGEGAKKFALMHGFKEENLLTEKARKEWIKWKENLNKKDNWLPPNDENKKVLESHGTINVLGINSKGEIAGITTTSGLAWKIPGRVGDSPIIGAGLYVDNDVGAAGAIGLGEEVIRTCGSFYLVEKMREGMSPQEASESICKRIIDIKKGPANVDFNVQFIAVNKLGEVGCASITGSKNWQPEVSTINNEGFKVISGTYIIER